jgi:hypothetical protein
MYFCNMHAAEKLASFSCVALWLRNPCKSPGVSRTAVARLADARPRGAASAGAACGIGRSRLDSHSHHRHVVICVTQSHWWRGSIANVISGFALAVALLEMETSRQAMRHMLANEPSVLHTLHCMTCARPFVRHWSLTGMLRLTGRLYALYSTTERVIGRPFSQVAALQGHPTFSVQLGEYICTEQLQSEPSHAGSASARVRCKQRLQQVQLAP